MSDDEIPYLKVRAVRDETGASHDDCRQVLRDSGGDVVAAVSLWFAGKRGGATASSAGTPATRRNGRHESQSERSQ